MELDSGSRVANTLVETYRRYVGEPDRLADVYVGFGLFFGGVTLGVVGVLVFLWATAIPSASPFHWQLREIAGALALTGLPAFLLSIPVLLPVDRRATYVAAVGGVVCLVGVGVFVASYPQHWNVQGTSDHSTLGVVVYTAGLVSLVGAGGAGLVSDRVERARLAGGGSETATDAASADDGAGDDPAVSDAEVERDIEEAMSDSELSWGGVEKTNTTRLDIDTGDEDVERSNLTTENANVSRSEGVDSAVSGLQKLRGGESTEETGEGADDQVAALQELRHQQEMEELATEDDDGVIDRVKSLFR